MLKVCVHQEPIAVDSDEGPTSVAGARPGGAAGAAAAAGNSLFGRARLAPSSAPNKPLSLQGGMGGGGKGGRKNEVYIDLMERMTVLIGANGAVLRAEIDGTLQMKSFLQGQPEIRVGLSEDLYLGKAAGAGARSIVLDDVVFHECVSLVDFEHSRTLALRPPDGEVRGVGWRLVVVCGFFILFFFSSSHLNLHISVYGDALPDRGGVPPDAAVPGDADARGDKRHDGRALRRLAAARLRHAGQGGRRNRLGARAAAARRDELRARAGRGRAARRV
jgi:hypothetical protein